MEKIPSNGPEKLNIAKIYESLGLAKYVIELRGKVRARLRADGKSEEEIAKLTQTPDENKADPMIIISQVISLDIEDLIAAYEKNKQDQLKEFAEKGEGFNPESGNFTNDDTSWWDTKIEELQNILEQTRNIN